MMTIEQLCYMRDTKRDDLTRIPASELSVAQSSLRSLNEIAVLLAEICIELKQWRMHE